MTMLKRRRLAIASGVQPVFPDSLGGWCDPSNVERVWRQVRNDAASTAWSATPCARLSPAKSSKSYSGPVKHERDSDPKSIH